MFINQIVKLIRRIHFTNPGACTFLILIVVGFIAHVPSVWNVVRNGEIKSFAEFTASLRRDLVSDFKWKHDFVDINGAYVRAIGQRVSNGIVRLHNGQLTSEAFLSRCADEIAALPKIANAFVGLSSWLKGRGVPFLHVQAPVMMDPQGVLSPYLTEHCINEVPEILCRELRSAGVNTLDLSEQFASSPEVVRKTFFTTDHHWTIDAAFSACPIIAGRILDAVGLDAKIARARFDSDKWNRFEKKNWFLGSRGRRVGRFFAGLDDISWYEPKEKDDVRMSCAIHKGERFRVGNFSEALILKDKLLPETRPPVYENNPYLLYLGGDFPLVSHRNQFAAVKLRVLLIQDSFGVPIQAFLSSLFTEIDVLDLRYFNEMSVPDYVESTSPDIVVTLYNPSMVIMPVATNFGTGPSGATKWSRVRHIQQLRIEKSPKPYNYCNLTPVDGLRNGGVYRLSFKQGSSPGKSGVGVTVCLHDLMSKKITATRVVDLDYIKENEERLCFKIPQSGKWRLLLYAGSRTSTGVEIDIGEVTLYERVVEHKKVELSRQSGI